MATECPFSFPPNSSLAPYFNHTHLTVGPAPSGCPSKLLEASPPPFYNLPPPSAYTEAATRLFASPTPPSFFLRPGASSPLGWYKIFSPSSSLHPRILLRDGSSRGSRAVGGFESGGRIRRVFFFFFFFLFFLFFFFFFFGGASGLFGVFALRRLGGEWNAQAPSVGHEPALSSCWEGAASSGRELALQRLSPSVLLPITDQSWPTASRVQRLRRRLRTRRPQGRAAEWGKQASRTFDHRALSTRGRKKLGEGLSPPKRRFS
ncbi:uncharacterized protein LOC132007009 [Mustela nigripes]|uniref:uncharacterized protein LOC132007009 n=1 Tax=Mustela nigripes TaxID=77151 RepID=UPI002815CE0A|nr:uncharacterized protein LOC132007009 [Mustela nigripes]